jgi:hypothetical protein
VIAQFLMVFISIDIYLYLSKAISMPPRVKKQLREAVQDIKSLMRCSFRGVNI